MPSTSRRHSNQDFASRMSLLLAELGFLGIMTYLFIGLPVDQYERGFTERLPLYQHEISTDTVFIPTKRVLHLELQKGNLLLCEGQPISLHQLPKLVEHHLYQAVASDTVYFVSLRTERAAAYPVYLAVKDVIRTQQSHQLKELALQTLGKNYSDDMTFAQRKALRKELKLDLIEWHPGENGDKPALVREYLRW